jgi:hypothetical protein
MACACAFSPGSPHLLASVSKGGEVALLDVRRLGAPPPAGGAAAAAATPAVWRRRVAAPVFGATWLVAGALGEEGEQLAVVGADAVLRLYAIAGAGARACAGLGGRPQARVGVPDVASATRPSGARPSTSAPTPTLPPPPPSLLAGPRPLGAPLELGMPGGYGGRLLAAAVSGDGRRAAAAGEAVPSEALRLERPRGSGGGGGRGAGTAGPGPAAAAAAAPARRRRGPRGGAVGLDALAGGDDDGGGGGGLEHLSLAEAPAPAPACESGGDSVLRAPLFVFSELEAAGGV